MNALASRKKFLLWLGAGLAGAVLPARPHHRATGPGAVHLQHNRVAGLAHHRWKEISPLAVPGSRLELRAEPGNPHDRYAVAVYWPGMAGGVKIGYLPRNTNHVVSHLLRQGIPVSATLKAIHPEERIDRQVEIKVEMATTTVS